MEDESLREKYTPFTDFLASIRVHCREGVKYWGLALNQRISYWSGIFKSKLQSVSVSLLTQQLQEEMMYVLRKERKDQKKSSEDLAFHWLISWIDTYEECVHAGKRSWKCDWNQCKWFVNEVWSLLRLITWEYRLCCDPNYLLVARSSHAVSVVCICDSQGISYEGSDWTVALAVGRNPFVSCPYECSRWSLESDPSGDLRSLAVHTWNMSWYLLCGWLLER